MGDAIAILDFKLSLQKKSNLKFSQKRCLKRTKKEHREIELGAAEAEALGTNV